jgi:hypothetical protein
VTKKIVKLLVDGGADINCKNINGETALDIAKSHGYDEIIKLIADEIKKRKKTEEFTLSKACSSRYYSNCCDKYFLKFNDADAKSAKEQRLIECDTLVGGNNMKPLLNSLVLLRDKHRPDQGNKLKGTGLQKPLLIFGFPDQKKKLKNITALQNPITLVDKKPYQLRFALQNSANYTANWFLNTLTSALSSDDATLDDGNEE